MEFLEVRLKGIQGNDAVLSLPPKATIQEVKYHLGEDKGVPAPDLCLIYKGIARQEPSCLTLCV